VELPDLPAAPVALERAGSLVAEPAASAAGVERGAARRAGEVPQPGPDQLGLDRVAIRVVEGSQTMARLWVAVAGKTVTARIVAAEPATGHRLETGLDELRQALESQGFERMRLSVHQPPAGKAEQQAAECWAGPADAVDPYGGLLLREGTRGSETSHTNDPASRQGYDGWRGQHRSRRERER